MKIGKAFELFVKHLLLNVGFSEVSSDGLYIFDGGPGQMIQGMGEAHNADVLLEPPVQTPFYAKSRILIECKDHRNPVSLNVLRSVLGLREDINNFNIVDKLELETRRAQNRRNSIISNIDKYTYQVAVASLSGFSKQAQKFASAYRIPLIEFNKMPFWYKFNELFGIHTNTINTSHIRERDRVVLHEASEQDIVDLANDIGNKTVVAITVSGQLLFLYRENGNENTFQDQYELYWDNPSDPWRMKFDNSSYLFQLPEEIMKTWIESSSGELELKKNAIECKADFLSNMVVYYRELGLPMIKMISINKFQLNAAKRRLNNDRGDN